MQYFVPIVIIMLIIITLFKTAKVVPQKSAFVVERLGKYSKTLEAGFHILLPFIDKIRYKLSMKEVAIDVPPQVCITKDNVSVEVDGILY
ncbi:MAG: paraslipin, partial [Candidatus Sabulitectum sp.]|nr:paraslipin [Candidatus Sabulitectum sp.]